jgi:hypothetical protein
MVFLDNGQTSSMLVKATFIPPWFQKLISWSLDLHGINWSSLALPCVLGWCWSFNIFVKFGLFTWEVFAYNHELGDDLEWSISQTTFESYKKRTPKVLFSTNKKGFIQCFILVTTYTTFDQICLFVWNEHSIGVCYLVPLKIIVVKYNYVWLCSVQHYARIVLHQKLPSRWNHKWIHGEIVHVVSPWFHYYAPTSSIAFYVLFLHSCGVEFNEEK